MMRLSSLLVLVMLFCSCGAVSAEVPAWVVDEDLGFHFALYDSDNRAPDADWQAVPVVRVNPGFDPVAPEIDNIDLDGIRGLGFPLPERPVPGSFTFFLKFYEFPVWLSAPVAAKRIVDGYGLHLLPDKQGFRAWLMKAEHLRVKKGLVARTGTVFSSSHPYPALVVPRNNVRVGADTLSPQAYFESRIPFISLYLKPVGNEPEGMSDDERTSWSGQGVLAFHQMLLEAYAANFETVAGADSEKFRYFRLPRGANDRILTILKVPVQPMAFEKNWRDLPMPQNPKKVFLSALLLIFRHEYLVTGILETETPVDSPSFKAATRLQKAQVFEVGSVVRQP